MCRESVDRLINYGTNDGGYIKEQFQNIDHVIE